MDENIKAILRPAVGTFRILALYVGQGESTLLIVPDGETRRYVLIDSNVDRKNGGTDIAKLLRDYLEDELDVFINTHPHKDHLNGIGKIHELKGIKEIWHSGHIPEKDNKEVYDQMADVIEKIGSENEYILFGTNDENKIRKNDKETEVIKKIGDADFVVLSPAEYVTEEIDGESPDDRRKRIHEQCGVIKFTYQGKSIIFTGDSDKTAWKEHITEYHKEKLPANILSASHHGSRTFFKNSEDDKDVYEDHIKAIAPESLILSAPTQKESPHGHPHDDALGLYKKYLSEENIYHLGDNRECLIIDIDEAGDVKYATSEELKDKYTLEEEGELSDTDKTTHIREPQGITSRSSQRKYSPYSKPYYSG